MNHGIGFLVTILSAVLADYFFNEPVHVFYIAEPAGFLALFVFVLVGFVIVAFIESLLLTIDRLQATDPKPSERAILHLPRLAFPPEIPI